jgi:hypothetical protein
MWINWLSLGTIPASRLSCLYLARNHPSLALCDLRVGVPSVTLNMNESTTFREGRRKTCLHCPNRLYRAIIQRWLSSSMHTLFVGPSCANNHSSLRTLFVSHRAPTTKVHTRTCFVGHRAPIIIHPCAPCLLATVRE